MNRIRNFVAAIIVFFLSVAFFSSTVYAQKDTSSLVNDFLKKYALEREISFDSQIQSKSILNSKVIDFSVKSDEIIRKEKLRNLEKN